MLARGVGQSADLLEDVKGKRRSNKLGRGEEKQRGQIKNKKLLLRSSSPKVYQLVQIDYCKDLSRKKYCFSEHLLSSSIQGRLL